MSSDDNQGTPDDDLFKNAMSDVQPLNQEKRPYYKKRHRPVPGDKNPGHAGDPADELVDLPVETPEFLEFVRPGIQKRLFHDLRRGMLPPEASLDLHGMRVVEAKPAFMRFLKQCTQAGTRTVRIIHGKGHGSDDRQPVLKQKTNQWLQQRQEVLAFCAAPRWDGGSGAVYVLLSRKFQDKD